MSDPMMTFSSATGHEKKLKPGRRAIPLNSCALISMRQSGAASRWKWKMRSKTPSLSRNKAPGPMRRNFTQTSMTSETKRELSYIDAVREATDQEMARDSSVILFGLDVDDPKAIHGTTRGLLEKFGPERVFGTPLSEDAMTGVAIGAALAGLRPIHVHIRMDFLMLAMNQLINIAAKSHYMYGGQVNVPMVVRAMIGKSWGQGAQHSQGLHGMFMHVPGIKVVAPSTPYDAKGCLAAAVRDDDPVLFVEHRMSHFQKGPVPEAAYTVMPGKARVTAEGDDVTLVGISSMQLECLRAQCYL